MTEIERFGMPILPLWRVFLGTGLGVTVSNAWMILAPNRECIVRVCEAAGLRTVDRKRKLDRRLLRVLAEKPIMEHAGEEYEQFRMEVWTNVHRESARNTHLRNTWR